MCNPLTKEAVMVSFPKVGGVVCCGLLLTMEVSSSVAQTEALDRRQSGQGPAESQSLLTEIGSPAGKTFQGEVLRVEGTDCVIKDQDGKEVRLQIDLPILKAENIEPGDRIEAQVHDKNHLLSFRPGGHGSPK
jgi:hypothetical protein